MVAKAAGPDGPVPIGIAHLAGAGCGPADVAVAVADTWQRRGVGRRPVTALAEKIGYTELRGAMLPHLLAMQPTSYAADCGAGGHLARPSTRPPWPPGISAADARKTSRPLTRVCWMGAPVANAAPRRRRLYPATR
ncbi:MAG: hypothetical protein L0H84_02115 [Pseudonocardia sp.]|nr:hypothetical protein [Pseudonocardia sp.]